MTRTEKLAASAQRYKATIAPTEKAWEPAADMRAEAFKARRNEQAMYPRYWARYGHELPKARKISGLITQS
jgi:hypothetical protein